MSSTGPAFHPWVCQKRWPLRSYLELGALPSAVPCARLHSKQVLWEWGLDNLAETVELLVSELVTNAVKASRETGQPIPVRLQLLSDKARVLIKAWDGNPRAPVPGDSGPASESGRGLLLVAALSEQWNWYASQEDGGKVVWALVTQITDDTHESETRLR